LDAPVSNVRMREIVSDANGAYWTPRLDNPGWSVGNSEDWEPYYGGSDIYWEVLDPRFDVLGQ